MAMEVGRASSQYALVTHTPPGRQQAPNPTCFRKRNVEIPYRSPRGQQAARLAHGDAGEGLRTKRTPSCNRMDNDTEEERENEAARHTRDALQGDASIASACSGAR